MSSVDVFDRLPGYVERVYPGLLYTERSRSAPDERGFALLRAVVTLRAQPACIVELTLEQVPRSDGILMVCASLGDQWQPLVKRVAPSSDAEVDSFFYECCELVVSAMAPQLNRR
jgi:hypothetical protein